MRILRGAPKACADVCGGLQGDAKARIAEAVCKPQALEDDPSPAEDVLSKKHNDYPGESPSQGGEPLEDAIVHGWDMHNGNAACKCTHVSMH